MRCRTKIYNNCVIGECLPAPSSSSGEESSSSSGDEETGVCKDNSFLSKSAANKYDDWVYEGETLYGYDTVLVSLNKRDGFYDILGRLAGTELADLEKKAKKIYIYKNRPPKRIFEVRQKTIPMYRKDYIDSSGDTVKFFRMENENVFWDSTAYSDGSWNVMKRNDLEREIKFYDSDGLKSTNNYDNKWRILNSVSMDNNGDTINIEKYIWENGKLIKTIFNGNSNVFIYGKTLMDTVRVIPSDKYTYGHYGYDGSVGLIPDEDEQYYQYFIRAPYSFYRSKAEKISFNLNKKIYALLKGGIYHFAEEKSDMPKAGYHNATKEEIPTKGIIYNIYPIYYAMSFAVPSYDFECEPVEEDGCVKYKIKHSDLTYEEYITIEQSGWVYKNKVWEHRCWSGSEVQYSYDHEETHLRNARRASKSLHKNFISTLSFDAEKECIKEGAKGINEIINTWKKWSEKEYAHNLSKSPKPSELREGELCDE